MDDKQDDYLEMLLLRPVIDDGDPLEVDFLLILLQVKILPHMHQHHFDL